MTKGRRNLVALIVGAGSVVSLFSVAAEVAESCEASHVRHLGPACQLADGHYMVFLADGSTLFTHGPDARASEDGPGFESEAPQRQPACADAWHMHALYGYRSDGPNRYYEVVTDLRDAIRRMNAVLNADALDSGGVEADYRVACGPDGDIQVDTFEVPAKAAKTHTADFSEVVGAAQAAGFDREGTDYLIFYDDGALDACGVGSIAWDDRLAADNANLKGPDYGVVYKDCWFGSTPMHENGHNQGAVQQLAPMSDLTGHCLEGMDVMCYPTSFVLVLCGDRVHFDCNYDTYFNVKPEAGTWLASHWNLGSRLNRYLAFGDAPPETLPLPASAHEPIPSPLQGGAVPIAPATAPLSDDSGAENGRDSTEQSDTTTGGFGALGVFLTGLVAMAGFYAILSRR